MNYVLLLSGLIAFAFAEAPHEDPETRTPSVSAGKPALVQQCLTKEEEERLAKKVSDQIRSGNPYNLPYGGTSVTLERARHIEEGEREGENETKTKTFGIKLNATVKIPIIGKVGFQSNPWSKIHTDLKTQTKEISTRTSYTVSTRLIGPDVKGDDEPWFKDGEIRSEGDKPVFIQCTVSQKLTIGDKNTKSVGTRDAKEHSAKVKLLIFEFGSKGDYHQESQATYCTKATEHTVETTWLSDPIRVPATLTVDGVTRRPRKEDIWKFCQPQINHRKKGVQKLQEEFAKDLLVYFDDRSTCAVDNDCKKMIRNSNQEVALCIPSFDNKEGFIISQCELRKVPGAPCQSHGECRPGQFCQLTKENTYIDAYTGELSFPIPSTNPTLTHRTFPDSRYVFRVKKGTVCADPDPALHYMISGKMTLIVDETEMKRGAKEIADHVAPKPDKLSPEERRRVLEMVEDIEPRPNYGPQSLHPCKCRDQFISIFQAPDGSNPIQNTPWVVGWCNSDRKATAALANEVEELRKRGSPRDVRWYGLECHRLAEPGKTDKTKRLEFASGVPIRSRITPVED